MTYYLGATELTLPGGATVGASTVPFNIGQVASVIFEFEGDADGYVAAAGYAVPVTTAATYAFATMRRAVKNGVSAFVLQTMFPAMGGPGDKTSSAYSYQQAYDTFRKSLKDGSLALVDAARDEGGSSGRALPRTGTATTRIGMDSRF